MDSELEPSIFEEPVCLIDSAPNGRLIANEKALRQLENIEETVNCVAIAGLYRTGKSYLLNRLAGKKSGFALSSTIESKTKGIWVWCTPHPHHPDQVLVLVDTEGLGDVAKQTNAIISLTRFIFVTEISKHIKTKEEDCEGNDFDYYFPNFVFCLRDFSLALKIGDRHITADEYLDHALEYKEGSDEKTAKYNEPRKCIRRYFKARKCFTFERPGNTPKLHNLENLTDAGLDKEFVANVEDFCRYIYHECPPKKLDIGTPVTGRMFVALVTSYVDSIRNGSVPCIENALNNMAKLENTKAVDEAVQFYDEFMTKNLTLPTNSDDTLPQVHRKALDKSVALFLKKAIYDTGNTYQRNMNEQVEQNHIEWINRNEQASVDKCKELLRNLNTVISNKLKDGDYSCKGGYEKYQQDLHDLQAKYNFSEALGVKAADTLLTFLNEKWTEGQSILKADESISAEQERVEEERQKAIKAERQRQAAEAEAAAQAELAAERETTLQENIRQLVKKTEEDKKNLKKHEEEVRLSRERELRAMNLELSLLRSDNRELKSRVKKLEQPSCFAHTSLVKVQQEDSSMVKMLLYELKVGDSVESYDFHTNRVVFFDVYFITHSTEGDTYGYDLLHLKFDMNDGIRLDGNHLIYVSKGDDLDVRPQTQPTRASEVNTGDRVWVREGEILIPRKVSESCETESGIRHPMTMNHVIIVNDVLASVHMYYERVYRALTSPLRLLYAASQSLVQSRFVTNVVNAWDYVEKFM